MSGWFDRLMQVGLMQVGQIGIGLAIALTTPLGATATPAPPSQPTPSPTATGPKIETTQAKQGDTQAELIHTPSPEPGRDGWRLRITRQGKLVMDRTIDTNQIPSLYRIMGLEVKDLDGDREPEVLFNNYSGGAHCCTSAHVYRFEAGKYQLSSKGFGNGGYRLQDSDKDGKLEFWSRDDAFAYRFIAYAGSRYPLQVWDYAKGNWQDITRRYGGALKDDAFGHWTNYQGMRQKLSPKPEQFELSQLRASLAPYLADKYLLNQGEDGWAKVKQAYTWPDRDTVLADLQRFLQANAYIPGPFSDRIEFQANSAESVIGGRLLPGVRHRYSINVRAGQSFMLDPDQPGPTIRVLFPDGKLWYSVAPGQAIGLRQLPQSGDYVIELTSDRDRRYGIQVQVR
jgi:hypothetical protein